MVLRAELDLTIKDNWSVDSATEIAKIFGYASGIAFDQALTAFIIGTVSPASITTLLEPVAINHFVNWQPPLPKV